MNETFADKVLIAGFVGQDVHLVLSVQEATREQ